MRPGSSTATCSSTSSRCRWPAGSPTCGARGACSCCGAPRLHGRLGPGRARPRRSTQLIAARIVQAVGGGILVPVGDGRRLAPVRVATGAAAGARRHRRADVPRHGRRAVRRGGDPRLDPPGHGAGGPRHRRRTARSTPSRRRGAGSSTSTSRSASIALVLAWAAVAGWETPRRAGRVDIVGGALFGVALVAGARSGSRLVGSTDIARQRRPRVVTAVLLAVAVLATALVVMRGLRRPRSVPRPAAVPDACRSARPRSCRC